MTAPRAVLLMLDFQEDFLARPTLSPTRTAVVSRAAELLDGCRALGTPVVHAHILVKADGSDRMPHWIRNDVWECVRGTPGAEPPAPLRPGAGEPVFAKQFHSAFGAPGFADALAALAPEVLLIAGVYSHACVRATATDAYARGYAVWIADDAIASTEPAHAEITRASLDGRVARFLPVASALDELGRGAGERAPPEREVPVACIGGTWRTAPPGDDRPRRRHLVPARLEEVCADVPLANDADVAEAAAAAAGAQRDWGRRRPDERAAALRGWARSFAAREDELAARLVEEVGKTRGDARWEARHTAHLIEISARLVESTRDERLPGESVVSVRRRPVGVVGLITPWNNPVLIPVAKLGPAVGFGNGVVWKPDPKAPRTAIAIMESLLEADLPADLVGFLFGEADTARAMIADPALDAISLTGSPEAGHSAAAQCLRHGKTLQAELGGNNAAIVLADADVEAEAGDLADAVFSFAGQRCTSPRRHLVQRGVFDAYVEALVAAARERRVGDPDDPETDVGPLVSPAHRARVAAAVDRARADGGTVLCGGGPPPGLDRGSYYAPTVVTGLGPESALFREETFGPVAMVVPIDDLDHGLRLANAVDQGLVASIASGDPAARSHFADAIEAGMVKVAPGPLAIHAEGPFGGWKASGLGPPEHGVWDREAYTRPQAVYGELPSTDP